LEELENKRESEQAQEASQESVVDKCFMNETQCKFCSTELPNQRFFPICDKDECRKKF